MVNITRASEKKQVLLTVPFLGQGQSFFFTPKFFIQPEIQRLSQDFHSGHGLPILCKRYRHSPGFERFDQGIHDAKRPVSAPRADTNVNALLSAGTKDSVVLHLCIRKAPGGPFDKRMRGFQNGGHGNAVLGIFLELNSDLNLPVLLIVPGGLCVLVSRDGYLVLIPISRGPEAECAWVSSHTPIFADIRGAEQGPSSSGRSSRARRPKCLSLRRDGLSKMQYQHQLKGYPCTITTTPWPKRSARMAPKGWS